MIDSVTIQDNAIINNTPYIDYDSVIRIYRDIQDIAARLRIINRKINAAAEYCDKNSFFVQGFTYEDNYFYCGSAFRYAIDNIDDYADALLNALNKVLAINNGNIGIIDDPVPPEVTDDE